MKSLWNRNEISVADELMALAPKLTEEFLAYHKDFYTTFSGGISYAAANPLTILEEHEKKKWKVEGIRYCFPEQNVERNLFLEPEIQRNFPTAVALTKKYLTPKYGCSGYSILEGGGVINPHVDIENSSHKTVRIHIPLIIPEGETYFRVMDKETDWSDLFAFDNGQLHSAYNKTKERRLIYIFDMTRSMLGISEYEGIEF
jgi:hypothetical protein